MKNVFPDNRREQFLEKPLPSSAESERAILGHIILYPESMLDVIGRLVPDDFYFPLHRRVFDAMLSLFAASKLINSIMIGEELKKEGALEAIGGTAVITNLTFGLPHFSDLNEYIKVVQDKATARALIRRCNETITSVLAEDEEVADTIDHHEQAVYVLRDRGATKDFSKLSDVAEKNFKTIVERVNRNEQIVLGIPTGWRDVDNMTSGLQKTDLVILAGRPSMGKTAAALQIALNTTAYNPDFVVAIFSMEMGEDSLGNRMLCQESFIHHHRYRTGHLLKNEWEKLSSGIDRLIPRKIFIEDAGALSALEIKARARKLRSKYKRLDLIIGDHLGLMKRPGKESPTIELGQITKACKVTAKELDVPFLLLSQLRRPGHGKKGDPPTMDELRQSGEIEEDADMAFLLHRDDYYNETDENRGMADLIVAKNRNGPLGTAKLSFLKEYMRFENYTEG